MEFGDCDDSSDDEYDDIFLEQQTMRQILLDKLKDTRSKQYSEAVSNYIPDNRSVGYDFNKLNEK